MIVAFLVVAANIVIAARLICYQRHGSRYRWQMSLLAYVLIVCAGGQTIDVLFNGAPASWWQAGISLVVAGLVLRARGNTACIVRMVS